MTKFWMVTMIAILALGSMTGCPDGDDDTCTGEGCVCGDGTCNWNEDCASCPSDCSFMCSDADADADSDAETDATDDGTMDEVANCPSVAGDWTLTYLNEVVPGETHLILTLEQDGCLVIGLDENCEYSGTISESGYISLFRDCYTYDRTVTGNFTQTPPNMEGTWNEMSRPDHGTWLADPL